MPPKKRGRPKKAVEATPVKQRKVTKPASVPDEEVGATKNATEIDEITRENQKLEKTTIDSMVAFNNKSKEISPFKRLKHSDCELTLVCGRTVIEIIQNYITFNYQGSMEAFNAEFGISEIVIPDEKTLNNGAVDLIIRLRGTCDKVGLVATFLVYKVTVEKLSYVNNIEIVAGREYRVTLAVNRYIFDKIGVVLGRKLYDVGVEKQLASRNVGYEFSNSITLVLSAPLEILMQGLCVVASMFREEVENLNTVVALDRDVYYPENLPLNYTNNMAEGISVSKGFFDLLKRYSSSESELSFSESTIGDDLQDGSSVRIPFLGMFKDPDLIQFKEPHEEFDKLNELTINKGLANLERYKSLLQNSI